MAVKEKILIVEDDKSIMSFLAAALAAEGFDVVQSRSGAEAKTLIQSHCPDVVLLDLGLPDMDGTEIITFVRAWSLLPIIIISARSEEKEKVTALELGADDYVTKPFGTSELVARIRTALRHVRLSGDASGASGKFVTGGLTVDYDKHRVYSDGEDTHLTQNEYKIVSLLARNAGRVMTYDFILRELWGPAGADDNKILRVNMANIRRKIEKNPGEPQYIFTEVGVGYIMADGGAQ